MKMMALAAGDTDAVKWHFSALSPEDFYLRFGLEKDERVEQRLMRAIDLAARYAMKNTFATFYGAWDEAHQDLQVVVMLAPVAGKGSAEVEVAISALPAARGGLMANLSGWLVGELERRKATDVALTYMQGNRPVHRLVEQLNMTQEKISGITFHRMKLAPAVNVLEAWIRGTDQLMAAARQELSASAKL